MLFRSILGSTPRPATNGRMVELVDTPDLKSGAHNGREGSTPSATTKHKYLCLVRYGGIGRHDPLQRGWRELWSLRVGSSPTIATNPQVVELVDTLS